MTAGKTVPELTSETPPIVGTDEVVVYRSPGPLKRATTATMRTYMAATSQPLDADLTAIAALTSAADKVPYATGAGTWAMADLTAAGRALLDDADAAAQRTTLAAVGTAALAASSGSALVGQIQSGDSPVAETVQSAIRNLGVRVEQFGVVGATSAGAAVNYATEIQRAINAAVTLKVPLIFAPGLFYRSDTNLTHSGPLIISGYGATLYTTGAITLLTPGSDLTIEGLTFQGPYSGYSANSYGIKGGGSANGAGVPPTRKSRMNFIDVTLKNFGSGGAWIEYGEFVNFTRPIVKECGWHGLVFLSTNDVLVLDPNVDTIYGNPGSGYNAYGVTFGADQPTNDTVRYPTCSRGLVSGGFVRNIPEWHGLDTHGGIDITFDGTTVIDCRRGAVLTSSDYSISVRCTISNVRSINTYPLEAVSASGGEKRAEGFWLQGTDCSLVNCYAFGHGMAFGNYGSSEAYGIYVGPSTRGRMQNCSAVNCLAGGVYIGAGANDFLIDNLLVDNPYTTTYGGGPPPNVTNAAPRYVEVGVTGSNAATGLFTGARFLKTDPSLGTNTGYVGYLIREGSGVLVTAIDTYYDGPVEKVSIIGTTTRFITQGGSKTHDFGSLVDGAGETTTVTVNGAVLGDLAAASLSVDLQGMTMTAWVSAANTVSVRLQNETGGTIDLASATLRARVFQAQI